MKATTKVEILREGEVRWVTNTECQTPEVVLADPSGIFDFSKLRTEPANECIYCGSQLNLSREHVLPYALGGTVTILRGSCERCRNVEGLLPRLEDKEALVHSMLGAPNTLGRFVGTLPPPFKKYPGVHHRIAFRETAEGLVVADIQLFASAGAPTYVVILGSRTSGSMLGTSMTMQHN